MKPLLLLSALCACAPSVPPARPVQAAALRVDSPPAAIELIPPRRTSYVLEALGAAPRPIQLRIHNPGSTALDLTGVGVHFSATRAGVRYPCADAVPPQREASTVRPGEALVSWRTMACDLPLPGAYRITATVHDRTARPLATRTFDLEVVARGDAPTAVAGSDSLFVAMTAPTLTRVLSAAEWAAGAYRVAVAIVNSSATQVEVGAARVRFETYRVGSPFPCEGEQVALAFPATLQPGQRAVRAAPVSCAPTLPGRYVIVGRFAREGTTGEREIGRVALTIADDPMQLFPEPWPRPWTEPRKPEVP